MTPDSEAGPVSRAIPESGLPRAAELIANYLWNEDGEDENWSAQWASRLNRLIEAYEIVQAATPSQPVPSGLDDGPWQQMSDAATPGPWEVTGTRGKRDGYIKGAGRTVADMRLRNGSADAALIVAAVNHVRSLLAATTAPPAEEKG